MTQLGPLCAVNEGIVHLDGILFLAVVVLLWMMDDIGVPRVECRVPVLSTYRDFAINFNEKSYCNLIVHILS